VARPLTTDYKAAGKDVTVDTLSIDNALQRLDDFSAEAPSTSRRRSRGRSRSPGR